MGTIYNLGMSSLCNLCGGPMLGCGHCGQCQPKCGCENKCPKRCGCPESILSIEPDSKDPAYLRFNLGGRSVWYDFTSVVKAAETCTKLKPDVSARALIYDAECGRQTISATSLGGIFHLSDLGDVDVNSIEDNAVLVYRKYSDCGENCDGATGWVGINPASSSEDSAEYILSSTANGKMQSIRPPANSSKKYYMTWDGNGKARWKQIKTVSPVPTDSDGKKWAVYVDPNNGELVVVKE